jgi:hypothetical protein
MSPVELTLLAAQVAPSDRFSGPDRALVVASLGLVQ